jgi:HK97 family phage portal protein
MRLADRLAGRALPTPESMPYQVLTQTFQAEGYESVGSTFESYAREGYQGNGIVFAVLNARLTYFSQATFKFRRLADHSLFGTEALSVLEDPWPGGGTGELLARMIQDADLAGNAFIRRKAGGTLERLRPDLVDIASVEDEDDSERVVGYVYWRDGRYLKSEPEMYPVDDVVHWSPIPDPLASWRGMSWLTPITREINSDTAMTVHKQAFLDNAATPNLVIRYASKLAPDQVALIRDRWNARYGGVRNSWKTAILDEGADLTVVGEGLERMAFTTVQAAGENRIAAAAGVPGIIVGLKEGLDAATYSNFNQAMRRYADGTLEFLWQSAVRALSKLVVVPDGAELWFDRSAITALREGENERAQTVQILAAAGLNLINAGYEPDAVTQALVAGDLSLLLGRHSGAIPTALYPDGRAPVTGGNA